MPGPWWPAVEGNKKLPSPERDESLTKPPWCHPICRTLVRPLSAVPRLVANQPALLAVRFLRAAARARVPRHSPSPGSHPPRLAVGVACAY